jgi:hypothetical protein
MGTMDWLVIAGGIAAIAWVNWYFFLAERDPRLRSRESEDRHR